MRGKTLVQAEDLDRWADSTLEARSLFPELVRRLVHATAKNITHASFPAGKGVELPGWDGTLVCTTPTAFTPSGASGWEFGTDQRVKSKADKDYRTRSLDPLQLTPADTVFVFVTPRKWTRRDKWTAEKNAENTWRERRPHSSLGNLTPIEYIQKLRGVA